MSRNTQVDDAFGSENSVDDDPVVRPEAAPPPGRRKAPSPRNCREFIRREAANAMPDIVTAFVQKAKDGSVPHFTSLAKVGGFDQRPSASNAPLRRRRSLAQQLLDEVERYEAEQAAQQSADSTETGTSQERS